MVGSGGSTPAPRFFRVGIQLKIFISATFTFPLQRTVVGVGPPPPATNWPSCPSLHATARENRKTCTPQLCSFAPARVHICCTAGPLPTAPVFPPCCMHRGCRPVVHGGNLNGESVFETHPVLFNIILCLLFIIAEFHFIQPYCFPYYYSYHYFICIVCIALSLFYLYFFLMLWLGIIFLLFYAPLPISHHFGHVFQEFQGHRSSEWRGCLLTDDLPHPIPGGFSNHPFSYGTLTVLTISNRQRPESFCM